MLVALGLAVLAAPLWCVAALLAMRGDLTLSLVPYLGLERRVWFRYTVEITNASWEDAARRCGITQLPTLWHLLIGDLTLVGPRAMPQGEIEVNSPLAAKRFLVTPGLVCLWWVRRRTNIAYGSELEADADYVETRSFRADLALLGRALVAACYGATQPCDRPRVDLFGLPIDNLAMSQAVQNIVAGLDGPPRQVCFVNADCVNLAFKNDDYREVLATAPLVLADGIGMKLAGRLFRRQFRENLCGTDLFPQLCAALQGTGKSIYLLGGRPGVARRVSQWITKNYPGTIVAGYRHGYFSPEEEPQVVAQIAAAKADVLLVAFGAPRQDLWVHQHLAASGTKVALGVGGLFDFYSGRIPRAPQWVREIGMEWCYRMTREPGRLWKRYIVGNTVFLARALWLRWNYRAT